MSEHRRIRDQDYQSMVVEASRTSDGAQKVLEAIDQTRRHIEEVHKVITFEKLPETSELLNAHVVALLRGEKF